MNKLISLVPAFVLGLSLGGLSLGGCIVANPEHCFNLAIDTNAWCALVHPEQPYCSPCAADNNGCVADEPDPDDCPTYTAPSTETGTAGTSTETSTSDDTSTDTSGTDTSGTDTSSTETSG
jgi:hypothetical protein